MCFSLVWTVFTWSATMSWQKFLMKISKIPELWRDIINVGLFIYFFRYFIMFLHHLAAKQVDDGLRKRNILIFHPQSPRYSVCFALSHCFPLNFWVEFSVQKKKKKSFLGRNKNSTTPVPPLCTLHKTIGRDSTTTPRVFPPSLQKRKDPSSCERRFFALDIPSSYLLFFFPGVHIIGTLFCKNIRRENPLENTSFDVKEVRHLDASSQAEWKFRSSPIVWSIELLNESNASLK